MRFSLRTLLLGVLILSLALLAGISQWELKKTRTELNDLRDKHGDLVVRDEGTIHIRTKENFDGALFKIEVFLPKGLKYELSYAMKNIPASGPAAEQTVMAALESGVNVITVTQSKGEQEHLFAFRLKSEQASYIHNIAVPNDEWIKNGQVVQTDYLGVEATEAMAPAPSITLLRERVLTVKNAGPTPGILIELKKK